MSTRLPAIRRMSCSSVRTTSAPRVGAESRPSRNPWMAIAGHPVAHAQLHAGEQVPVERVHAPRAQQADQVEGAARWRTPAQSSTSGGSW